MANVAWHVLERKPLYTITCRAEHVPSLLQAEVSRSSRLLSPDRIWQGMHQGLGVTGLSTSSCSCWCLWQRRMVELGRYHLGRLNQYMDILFPWYAMNKYCLTQQWTALLPHCRLILLIYMPGRAFLFSQSLTYVCFRSQDCLRTFSRGFLVILGCSFPRAVTGISACFQSDSYPPLITGLCTWLLLDTQPLCSAPRGAHWRCCGPGLRRGPQGGFGCGPPLCPAGPRLPPCPAIQTPAWWEQSPRPLPRWLL